MTAHPKRLSLLLAHPDPGSLNHALARAVAAEARLSGWRVAFHDLYAEGFPPALPAGEIRRGAKLPPLVARHCREIAGADGIVIVHPNWWGKPPAILSGWIDRVLRPGVAYEFIEGDSGEGVPRGLLKARWALVVNTSNTDAKREKKTFHDPLEHIWRDCVFDLCGVKKVQRRVFRIVVTSTRARRERWIQSIRKDASRLMSFR